MSLFSTGTELGRFRKGTLPRIAIAVLLFIPLIYGALYLWAFWAPTDNMDRLPVAIVNLDQPAQKPDGGELTAGADVVDELLDGGDLGWQTLDPDTAAQQVADGDVYFSVTIPADFSATLAGLQDDPQAGQIDVVYNDNNSFLASTLGKQAMVQLRDAVAETTTRTAASEVLVGVKRLSDGTRDAADAASTLDDGAQALASASGKLNVGLGDLSSGTAQLAEKAPELAAGAGALSTGLETARQGSGELATGSAELASKTAEAATGAATLSSGLGELDTGATALATGAATALDGSGQLATGLETLAQGTSSVSQGTGLIAQLAAAHPEMTLAQLDAQFAGAGTSLAALAEGSAAVQTGADTASTSAATLRDGISQLKDGAATLSAGATSASTGANDLSDGLGQLAIGAQTVSDGNASLSAGVGTAADGASQLASGSGELVSGTTQLNDGAQQASEGSAALAKGAGKVHDGSTKFAEKLSDGAAEAPSFASGQTDRIASTMAAPVELHETTENPVQGFGEGFAPFFIALATFVGALITWLILHALPKRPLASNTSGLRSVLTGFWPAAIIGVGQVVIMMLVLVYGIGIQPAHWLGMSLFMLLVTLAFLALQQMFIVLLGTATGRVVSLVLLMLQLSSSGGTYPVETTPVFFQVLHPFMPASYVVDGLRQLIGGGLDARFWIALAVMTAILLGSLAISAASARSQKVWTIKRLHPELAI